MLIGNKNVGKTTFIYNFLNKKDTKIQPTIGFDYHDTFIEAKQGVVKLRIWDLSGSFTYENVFDKYVKSCHGFIFFYDVSNNESLLDIETWVKRIESCIEGKIYEKNIDYILIGNKSDLYEKTNKDLTRIKDDYIFESFTNNHLYGKPQKYVFYLVSKILNNQNTKNTIFKILDDKDGIVLYDSDNYEIVINRNACCYC